jgi:hypothetical protein
MADGTIGRAGNMIKRRIVIACAVTCLSAAPAWARDRGDAEAPPQAYQDLVACRLIAEAATRLACFDRNAAALEAATQSHDVVITDRETVRQARRGLFGFAAPVARLIGFGGNDDKDEVKEVQTKVARVSRSRDGDLKMSFEDGSTWEQIDTRDFVLVPKPGQSVRITRGAVGSYFVAVQNQHGIKMRRVE